MLKIKDMNKAMDYKKAIITHLVDLKNQIEKGIINDLDILNRDFDLIIHTHNSIIKGTVNLFESEEEKRTFLDYGLNELGKELEELPGDMTAFNVTGPIHIKGVKITTLSNPERETLVDEMIVFSDQVLGISVTSTN